MNGPPKAMVDKMTDCEGSGGGCATDLDSRLNSIFPTNFAALRAPTFPLAVPLLTIVRLNSNWEEFRQIRDSIREIPRDAPPLWPLWDLPRKEIKICLQTKLNFQFNEGDRMYFVTMTDTQVKLKGDTVNLPQNFHHHWSHQTYY